MNEGKEIRKRIISNDGYWEELIEGMFDDYVLGGKNKTIPGLRKDMVKRVLSVKNELLESPPVDIEGLMPSEEEFKAFLKENTDSIILGHTGTNFEPIYNWFKSKLSAHVPQLKGGEAKTQ